MIIDTHIHLYDDRYIEKLDETIKEAFLEGVVKMIIVGFDYESSVKAIELSNKYPNFYAAIGLHPSEVHKNNNEDIRWIYKLITHPKVIAIGEIGLDYYWSKDYIELQKELFINQIKIAKEKKLPIIVHSRLASNDTYTILKENLVKGVLHCYSQSVEMAKEYVKMGYFLGIGGVLTFKNSREIKEVVKTIDLKYLVVETDGPYLAPTPFRGKLNKPAYLKYVIEEIANIKNLSIGEVKKSLENSTKNLFGI